MNKKILIPVIVVIVIAIVGALVLIGLSGDDFATNMKEAGSANAEEVMLSMELEESLNDYSKEGLEKNINLSNQVIPLLEKMDVSFKNALNSTDNETIKEYLNLAIELNQLSLKEAKNRLTIFKTEQDRNNKKISDSEYNKKFNEYKENYDNYVKNTKKITKKIDDLLKNNPDFVEELKSYGFAGGLYLGEFGMYPN